MIQKIYNALDLMRNSTCEVPFIAFYRKEEVQPELNIHDLWKVYQWDEKVGCLPSLLLMINVSGALLVVCVLFIYVFIIFGIFVLRILQYSILCMLKQIPQSVPC